MPTPPPDPNGREPGDNPAPGSTADQRKPAEAASIGSTGSHHHSKPGQPNPSDSKRSGAKADPIAIDPNLIRMLGHPGASPIVAGSSHPGANTDDAPTVITRTHTALPQPTPLPVAGDPPVIAGRRLGHFELIEAIGAGGMAAVLKARDLELGRVVALKILPPETARDPETISRFKQEARAAAMLDHENIARAYFCGEDQGLHFIAFEFVEGVNLRQMIDRLGTVAVPDCISFMIQIASGLNHASERGVVHRDIKPSNIIITPDGRAKIVDMGLARRLDEINGGVTHSGVTLGTFDYISPEQALDPRRADVRSDIYSLGCTFYHALTGRPPVPEGTAAKKLHAHQHVDPLDPRQINPNLPDDLAAVLAGMMAKNPDQRYGSPAELIAHLKGIAERLRLSMPAIESDSTVQSVRASRSVLPEPPRLRAGWVLAASIAAIALAAIGLSGGNFNRRLELPSWATPNPAPVEGGNPATGQQTRPAPQPADGVVLAHTVEDLVEALGNPKTTSIHLDPTTYDLTARAHGLVFSGKEIELVGATTAAGTTRIVLNAGRHPPGLVQPPPGSLTIKSDSVIARGIRFEFLEDPGGELLDPGLADVRPVGLLVHAGGLVSLVDCSFGSKVPLEAEAVAVAVSASVDHPLVRIRVDRCVFANGKDHARAGIGLQVPARSDVTIEDSGFGPHLAAIQVLPAKDESGDSPLPTAPALLALIRSSFMLDPGCTAIETATPITVTGSNCLFASVGTVPSSPPATPTGLLIHATARPDGVRFTGLQKNAYYRVAPFAVGTGEKVQFYSFDQCKTEKFPIADPDSVALVQRPWSDAAPLDALIERSPWRAFGLDPTEPRLALPDRKIAIVGAQFHASGSSSRRAYANLPWPPSNMPKNPPVAAERNLVWFPDSPDDPLPRDTFTDLGTLLRNARPGDKVLIRHDGLLPVDPASQSTVVLKPRIGAGEFRLTFKPFPGCKPILTAPGGQVLDQTLFRLMGGEVLFDGLQFLLKPSRPRNPQIVAAVAIVGGKTCHFTNCVFTLAEEDDAKAAVVLVADPEMVMAMDGTPRPTPDVRFDKCLIRGKGRGVWAPVNRAVKVEASQTLSAIDGSLFLSEAGGKPIAGARSSLKLLRSTLFVGGPIVEMKAGKSSEMMRAGGLLPLDVEADDCLFAAVPGAGQPLVELEGFDAADVKLLLSWQVRRANRYAVLDETAAAMMAKPVGDGEPAKLWTWAQWIDFAGEPPAAGKPIGKVMFERAPAGLKDLALMRTADAIVKEVDFPDLTDPKPGDAGADAKLLPAVWEEPRPE